MKKRYNIKKVNDFISKMILAGINSEKKRDFYFSLGVKAIYIKKLWTILEKK